MSIFRNPNFIANGIKNIDDMKALCDAPKDVFDNMKITHPFLATPKWAVGRLKAWGEDSMLFQSRVMSMFPKQALDTLIGLGDLEKCKEPEELNTIFWKRPRATAKVLAVDPARYGDDTTVFMGYHKWRPEYKLKYQGQDTMYTANMIIKLIKERQYEVVVIDSVGIGAGVADKVNEWLGEQKAYNVRVIEFMGGSKASTEAMQEEYHDLNAEAWGLTKKTVEAAKIVVEDEGDLFLQLTSRKWKPDSKGRTQLEKKEDMKKRALKSPDEADAFVMCVWGMNQYSLEEMIDDVAFGKELETANAAWEM